ncbi:hypothetical protein DC498_17605 [Terrimonas sp.]|nr:hypothetical protein DC498_17605 [Terrimonas sp.]
MLKWFGLKIRWNNNQGDTKIFIFLYFLIHLLINHVTIIIRQEKILSLFVLCYLQVMLIRITLIKQKTGYQIYDIRFY